MTVLDGAPVTSGNLVKREEQESAKIVTAERRSERRAALRHDCKVIGAYTSTTNEYTITVDSSGKINKFSFKRHEPTPTSPFVLGAGCTKSLHLRSSELLVLATAAFECRVVDLKSFNVVRRCRGHTGIITGLSATPDGRRVFSSSMDKTLRVWDVPTGQCVDWLEFAKAPTSVSCSATSEFLATTHADELGVSVWADKSFYQTVYVNGAVERPTKMSEPEAVVEELDEGVGAEATSRANSLARDDVTSSRRREEKRKEEMGGVLAKEGAGKIVPKQEGLVTMSGLPQSHWKSLFKLELIKLRNKPTEPPKKPEAAPFFLQQRKDGEDPFKKIEAVAGKKKEIVVEKAEKKLEGWDAAWSDDDEEEEEEEELLGMDVEEEAKYESKLMKNGAFEKGKERFKPPRSSLCQLLEGGGGEAQITAYLGGLGPSAVDIAVRSLCSGEFDSDGIDFVVMFAEYLGEACGTNENFEAVNAYLSRFLTIHGALIRGGGGEDGEDGGERRERRMEQARELAERIGDLKVAQAGAGGRLKNRFQYTLSLLRTFSKIV